MNAHGVRAPLPGGLMNLLTRLSAITDVLRPVLSTFLRMGDVAPIRSLGRLLGGYRWDTRFRKPNDSLEQEKVPLRLKALKLFR